MNVTGSKPDDLVRTDFVRTSSAPGIGTSSVDSSVYRSTNFSAEPSSCLIYPGNNLSTGSTRQFEFNDGCDRLPKHLIYQPRSLSDEMRHRDCLTKALTDLCKYVTENTVIVGYELDELESKNCITSEDRVHVESSRIGPMKRTRRLLSLMLLRDYRTLLAFLTSLLYQNRYVVERILSEFDNFLRINYRKPPKCTLCQLESRVDVSLVVDELLSNDDDDDRWLMFYHRVSQTDFVGPNADFWRELISVVNTGGIHGKISDIIIEALSNCGFHSDIVKMLNEDKEHQRNSFFCRCSETDRRIRNSRDLNFSQNLPEHHSTNNDRSTELLEGRSSVLVEHYGYHHVRTVDVSKTNSELSQRTVLDNRIKDENVNQSNEKKQFSSKSKYLGSLNECRPKMVESVHEKTIWSKTMLKGKGWLEKNKQLDHTAHDCLPNSDTTGQQMELLKTAEHEYESEIETLKKTEWTGEISTTNGSGGKPQTYGDHDIQMKLLKDDMQKEEIETGKTKWPDGGNIDDSVDLYKSLSFDTDTHEIEELKSGVPENEDDDVRCEPKLDFLKIGIPGYEIDYDSGISPDQSIRNSESDDSTVDLETITDDKEEILLELTDNNNHPSHATKRLQQASNSKTLSDLNEQCNQTEMSGKNKSVVRQGTLTDDKKRANGSDEQGFISNFLTFVIFCICLFNYLVQNIYAYNQDT